MSEEKYGGLTESDISSLIKAFQASDRTVAMFHAVARIKDEASREAWDEGYLCADNGGSEESNPYASSPDPG
jgi:hypothetical protein